MEERITATEAVEMPEQEKCAYEGYVDEVLGPEASKHIVGAKCMDCKVNGGYLKCPRFQKIKEEGKAWWQ